MYWRWDGLTSIVRVEPVNVKGGGGLRVDRVGEGECASSAF